MEEFTVYRIGSLAKQSEFGSRSELYELIDACRPAEMTSRTAGLFCMPTAGGASRWLRVATSRAKRLGRATLPEPFWQLTCEGARPPVHSCVDWEAASDAFDHLRRERRRGNEQSQQASQRRLEALCRFYWSHVLTFDDYTAGKIAGHPWCPDQVEVLIVPQQIIAAKIYQPAPVVVHHAEVIAA